MVSWCRLMDLQSAREQRAKDLSKRGVRPLFDRSKARLERGFTLIELMVVVAIIAVLAIIVVPTFVGEAKKVSAKSEVTAMFAELAAKEDRYKNENGAYRELACLHATLTNQSQAVPCTTDTDYLALGILAPTANIRCSYTVVVGNAGTAPTAAYQPDGITTFTSIVPSIVPPSPAVGWYVIQAKCNMDNDSGAYSYYLTSSLDQTLRVANEGK